MPSIRLNLIQKGSNIVNDDEKTLISIFKEAMESPELFQFKDYTEAVPSKDVDLIVGFIKKKHYKKWLKSINLEYRWLKKTRIYSTSNNDKDTPQKRPKKSSYLKEYYFHCSSSGTYTLKLQQGPESRYKTPRSLSSIKTACTAKVYIKKPKSMPKSYLIGIMPRHNHPPIKYKGPLNTITKNWLDEKVKMGYTKAQIKEALKKAEEQYKDSPDFKPLLQIQNYHIEYRIRHHGNNSNESNEDPSTNINDSDIDYSFIDDICDSSDDSDSSESQIDDNDNSANNIENHDSTENHITSTNFNNGTISGEQPIQYVNNSPPPPPPSPPPPMTRNWNPHLLQSTCFGKNLYELTKEQKVGECLHLLNTTFNWFDMIVKSSPEKIDESIGYIKGLERYMSSLATGVQYPWHVDEYGRPMYQL
ncbi:hypothetical protein MG5_00752 [Candida albicans P57072]|nr:hypothetical protein MG5_00752 [Candida albicans P57072]KHC42299.1 hypothetical protein MGQ_00747 [Candida albicans P76067]